jgi:hypothetical protein
MYRPAWRISQVGVTSTGSQRQARTNLELGADIVLLNLPWLSENPEAQREAPYNTEQSYRWVARTALFPWAVPLPSQLSICCMNKRFPHCTLTMEGFPFPLRGIWDFRNVSPW